MFVRTEERDARSSWGACLKYFVHRKIRHSGTDDSKLSRSIAGKLTVNSIFFSTYICTDAGRSGSNALVMEGSFASDLVSFHSSGDRRFTIRFLHTSNNYVEYFLFQISFSLVTIFSYLRRYIRAGNIFIVHLKNIPVLTALTYTCNIYDDYVRECYYYSPADCRTILYAHASYQGFHQPTIRNEGIRNESELPSDIIWYQVFNQKTYCSEHRIDYSDRGCNLGATSIVLYHIINQSERVFQFTSGQVIWLFNG